MASHGGILGLVAVTFVISRRWKISWTSIGDTLCVVAPVGLFLVRCANFINGELYGEPVQPPHTPWAVHFPAEMVASRAKAEAVFDKIDQAGLTTVLQEQEGSWSEQIIRAARTDARVAGILKEVLPPRHPSQLYEAGLEGVLLFSVLWLLRTRCRMPRGTLTGLFFILYAGLRIIGEMFRVPDAAWHVGPLSAGQFLSLFMFAIGAAFLVWGVRARQYERADQGD